MGMLLSPVRAFSATQHQHASLIIHDMATTTTTTTTGYNMLYPGAGMLKIPPLSTLDTYHHSGSIFSNNIANIIT
jgi:hypothetical protein